MLSALHGIGVIVLEVNNIMESEVVIPALFRPEVDWCSINRLVEENTDMKKFIRKVTAYYKSAILEGFEGIRETGREFSHG